MRLKRHDFRGPRPSRAASLGSRLDLVADQKPRPLRVRVVWAQVSQQEQQQDREHS
jgi:hypothetical protein